VLKSGKATISIERYQRKPIVIHQVLEVWHFIKQLDVHDVKQWHLSCKCKSEGHKRLHGRAEGHQSGETKFSKWDLQQPCDLVWGSYGNGIADLTQKLNGSTRLHGVCLMAGVLRINKVNKTCRCHNSRGYPCSECLDPGENFEDDVAGALEFILGECREADLYWLPWVRRGDLYCHRE
jgi:hypothetical protein